LYEALAPRPLYTLLLRACCKIPRIAKARTPESKQTGTKTAKKPAGTPGRTKVPPTIQVVVNAAMRTRYEKHLADFKRAQGAELVQWDAAYESLDTILSAEPPLYLAGGFKTAKAFIAAVLPGVTLETVRASARVARHFDPDAEKKHGVAKLALLLDYLEAKNGGVLPDVRIDPDRTKVAYKGGSVLFQTLSYDALRDAVRAAKGRQPASAKELPEVGALRAVFAKAGLGNVTLALREARWSFGRIETRQFKDLSAALARAAKKG
jgi:hypothetical protein